MKLKKQREKEKKSLLGQDFSVIAMTETFIDYEMCGVKVKSVQLVKDHGASVSSNLKVSQQCIEAVKNANGCWV